MQITPAMIYWITRLDKIASIFTGLSIFTTIGTICLAVGLLFFYEEMGAKMRPIVKRWAIIFTVCAISFSLANAFLPTTKEMVAIYVIPEIAQSKTISNLTDSTENVSEFLKQKSEQWLKEQLDIQKEK